jgi:hypothetical protein
VAFVDFGGQLPDAVGVGAHESPLVGRATSDSASIATQPVLPVIQATARPDGNEPSNVITWPRDVTGPSITAW